jgi:hypothetical protein
MLAVRVLASQDEALVKKSKFQFKVWQATMKRKRERQDNNRRAAWNRVGARFNLSKEILDEAKKSGLSPYRLLRDPAATRNSVEACVQLGYYAERREYDWADLAIEEEIAKARAEQDGEEVDDCPF